jgi:hypothetical protein
VSRSAFAQRRAHSSKIAESAGCVME